jgi:hypothetical protein
MKLKDFLNSINYDKTPLFDQDEKAEKLYPAFVVNKCLSYFSDTIFHVNEINTKWWLDKKMQFDFYRLGVRKKKRYSPWIKKETEENIAIIKEVYGYTDSKAQEVLNILGPKDIDILKMSLQKGGTNNKE